ncbi:MAG: hypothetical protein EA361_06350 [Bacteroidetes bacterium]|nr:MAG: hypothetical protein EA361_06350 [Bacteroidota bacterium]
MACCYDGVFFEEAVTSGKHRIELMHTTLRNQLAAQQTFCLFQCYLNKYIAGAAIKKPVFI